LISIKNPLILCLLLVYSSGASLATANTLHRARARLVAAAIVQRFPIITAEMNEIEKRYADFTNKRNVDNSYLSDHELRHLKDKENANQKKEKEEVDAELLETALDYEEKRLKLLSEYKFESRLPSEKDKTNFKSMSRQMDRKIFLLVKNKTTGEWEFPNVEWKEGENLKQTAARSISSLSMKVQFIGNAPCGLFKNEENKQNDNLKTYFFKADYISDEIEPSYGEFKDYVWITKPELKDYIKNDKYYKAIDEFLLDF
jgi:large subunit ribosomal protein L46